MTTGAGVDLIGDWFGTGSIAGIALVFTLTTGIIGLGVTFPRDKLAVLQITVRPIFKAKSQFPSRRIDMIKTPIPSTNGCTPSSTASSSPPTTPAQSSPRHLFGGIDRHPGHYPRHRRRRCRRTWSLPGPRNRPGTCHPQWRAQRRRARCDRKAPSCCEISNMPAALELNPEQRAAWAEIRADDGRIHHRSSRTRPAPPALGTPARSGSAGSRSAGAWAISSANMASR